jgi:aryl-alcohol dehydrogenase-like predicted oxidoreductase
LWNPSRAVHRAALIVSKELDMTANIEPIPTVQLGKIGPIVGMQGLGCMAMATGYYGPQDDAETLATLERAIDLGVTLFDTADAYGNGMNEEFIGPFVRANRDRVVLATKFGIVQRDGVTGIDNHPDHIRASVEGSLRRLGIDVIDLYYMHRRDPAIPFADSIGTMSDLVKAGKVRYLGLSEVTAAELREANAIHPISALETEWSLFSREAEDEIVTTAAELGIGFVPYSPLGRGQLTGGHDAKNLEAGDVRHYMSRFSEENHAANSTLVAGIRDLATKRGATPAQIALAWLHHQSKVFGLAVVPIPGTRKPSRIEENASGAHIALSDQEIAELRRLGQAVKGGRDRMI